MPSAGTYSLDFQLTSSEAPTTNSAAIANLQFGGGGLLATQFYPPNGGHSGDASTTLTLMASDFFNSVTQDFTPGAFVGFDLDLTNVGPAGAIPDQSRLRFCATASNCRPGDTLGFNRLIQYDFTGDAAAPTARFDLVAVPEPATLTCSGKHCCYVRWHAGSAVAADASQRARPTVFGVNSIMLSI